MKKFNKIFGFRTNTLWKKIIVSLCYLFCFLFIMLSIDDMPEIHANIYDTIIYKVSTIIISASFLILLSDFKFKNNIPILKTKKWWSNLIGFSIIFILIICCSNVISLFHTKDYKIRYEEYYKTELVYQNGENDEYFEDDKIISKENELKDNFENSEEVSNNNTNSNKETIENKIKIHYIDVGQGDSIFIELPNDDTMLIDAGEYSKGKIIESYIKNLGFSEINYLVGTHPHADHIGGLAHIINTFEIENIYMPKVISTSQTYENLLNTISQKELKVITAKAGVEIINSNNLKVNIISPANSSYNNLNNYSAVIKINYKNKSFLFMGDAEETIENEILTDVKADVIKVGHHGSDTSSGESFVSRVRPKYAIIMVGTNNRYDHPYQSIIDRWKNIGATIYRTDLNGNIIITSDGNTIEVTTSK